MKKGVSGFTSEYGDSGSVSFHMPGHKGSKIFGRFGFQGFLKDHPQRDITEIHGADNLFQPEGIIERTMEKYRRLYDSKASYLLINGSSGGLIAATMTCVAPGEKLIMARNCHKSVFNALRLGGIRPVYAYPEIVEKYGISGALSTKHLAELVKEHPDAKAIILPSPNYYGICSDIKRIADIAHGAGMALIVDQAHGAHLKFFERSSLLDMPLSAESSGADIVINSTHKTLCSLTQSAILNVCDSGDAPVFSNWEKGLFLLEDRLQMIQSTSPSYLLMESLDINPDILADHGDELIEEWINNLKWFYGEAEMIPGLKTMNTDGMDLTKIDLDMSRCGLDGAALDSELRNCGIYGELATGNILMCMTGIGNIIEDYERLLDSLSKIAGRCFEENDGKMVAGSSALDSTSSSDPSGSSGAIPSNTPLGSWAIRRRWEGIPAESELVDLSSAAGRVCSASLIPYPPGIPLVCPGEVITDEDVRYISDLRSRGEKVIGVDHNGRIAVGGSF